MGELQYYNGKEWVHVGCYYSISIAFATLGIDNYNYRFVDTFGNVTYTDKGNSLNLI